MAKGKSSSVRSKKKPTVSKRNPARGHLFEIVKCSFPSGDSECSADLYRPLFKKKAPHARLPIVVMAHGFGAERTFRLPAYAERFARRGMAVLLFDYRNFGTSPGRPRNWISPSRHQVDWRSAVRFVRGLQGIDPERVALWGTSFSAGHIVALAGGVKPAGISLAVPFSDGLRHLFQLPPWFVMRAVLHGLWDLFAGLLGGVHEVKIFGRPDEFALLNTAECESGYGGIVDAESSWENRAPARIALTVPLYRPVTKAGRIRCPTFLVAGESDSICPLPLVQRLAKSIPGSMLMLIPTGHFEPYSGEWFEKVSEAQTQFLTQILRPEPV